jgi:aspartate/methionine/tyrosine aminotransferase
VFSDRTAWPTSANRFTRALERARAGGRALWDLTVSNPTTCGFEYEADAIRRALEHPEVLQYRPDPRGLISARTAIARLYPGDLKAEQIFITAGTSEAYAHVFRLLCNAGDEVLIAAPGYPLLDLIADLCDVRLVKYHLFYDHAWHIDLHDLESKISNRTRAIVLVHPNNPTGSYVGEREALNEICARRGPALIVDEVFLDFALEETLAPSFAGNGPVLTFTLNGLSKMAGLPQMKAAWTIVSGRAAERDEAARRMEFINDTFLSASTPVQLALPQLLTTRESFQKQVIARAKANLRTLDSLLADGHACSRPFVAAGWYVVLRVPALGSDEDLAIDLVEKDAVVVESGHFFDFPSDGYLVLSLLTPEGVFTEGVRRILERF